MTNDGHPARNTFSAAWGIIAVVALLIFAVTRLAPIAVEAFRVEWTALQWAVFVINTLFMAWSEGYRGFQKSFSPRVATRAFHIYRNDVRMRTRLLAPFFCCGYFGAGRHTGRVVWISTVAIIALIVIVQQFDQPWRGIIDAGVVVGLSWGVVSLLVFVVRTFSTGVHERSRGVT